MTNLLDQLAQSCTFTTINGRLTQVGDEGGIPDKRILLRKDTILDAKYKIVGLIGEGGMGAIYRVQHLMLHKEMALKTFRSQGLSPESWHRFQREAQAIARLDHENIVHVFDFGITQDNLPYYTMELLSGQSLADEIKQSGRMAPATALRIFRQVAAALAHAHRQNIVHRDIKPGNIFLVTDNSGKTQAKLVDFGIAKLAENTVLNEELSLTRAGTIFGSPLYMSPEQSLSLPTDLRTDMYSFGCTLYHALTGSPPFVGKNAYLTITLHQTKPAPSLQDSGIDLVVPQRMEKLIARLLAKKPEKRFDSFDEIEAELKWCRRAIQNEPSAPDTSTYAKIPKSGLAEENRFESRSKTQNTDSRMLAVLAISAIGVIVVAIFIALGLLFKPTLKPSQKAATTQLSNGTGSFLVETKDGTKTFLFPENRTYGSLKYGDKNINCQGRVTVPSDAKIVFYPDTIFQEQPELFERFGPDDLHGIQLNYYGDFWQEKHVEKICKLKGLKYLQLAGLKEVKLSTIFLIDKLENLQYLSLSLSEAKSEDLIHLRRLSKLNFLRVSNVTDLPLLFRFLASHNVNLKALVANASAVTDDDFMTIAKIKSLVYFSGQSNKITNKAFMEVDPAPHWQSLNIMGNPMNDGAIDSFAKFKDLQFLNLATPQFSKAGMERLKKKLPPNCKVLDLNGYKFEEACQTILESLQ